MGIFNKQKSKISSNQTIAIVGVIGVIISFVVFIQTPIDKLETNMDAKFSKIDTKLDSLIKSLNAYNINIEHRLTKLESK